MTFTPPSPPSPDTGRLCLRSVDGEELAADGSRWLAQPAPEEETVLDLAEGPVLDVGCGPGRHVMALAGRGVMALGIDITPSAVRLARRRGALVLERSVFEHVPGKGRWGSALLLDGNVGIGGDAPALLARLATLLRPGGRVLAELEGPSAPRRQTTVRLEHRGRPGPWFPWAWVSVDRLPEMAAPAGLAVVDVWSCGGRWFARLDRT
ncbi:MAG: class I SAM-dependent methyltransferase [Actinomycetota bacterium]|nr:class I SAM-dependent methyltransferase [Actinomycetota bacterium]